MSKNGRVKHYFFRNFFQRKTGGVVQHSDAEKYLCASKLTIMRQLVHRTENQYYDTKPFRQGGA
jgi:hypothetical protein